MATWEEAISMVLANADGALHYTEIAERILAQQLRENPGATPAQTVAATLSLSLRDPSTPFQRVARGEYILRDHVLSAPITQRAEEEAEAEAAAAEDDLKSAAGAIQAFGMYWRRDAVNWTGGRPQILGRQSAGAAQVDFADQIGVYLLHDRDRVIYVGRAADAMHTRLKAHTTDRLNGRWDRFSWFGLRDVSTEGGLSEAAVDWTQDVVIETLEALLIETLEPPLNRRRGDNFAAVEYLQVDDPAVQAAQVTTLVASLLRR